MIIIVICGLSGSTIFFHILINGRIFGRKLLNIKCVFWFSLQLLSETFLILRRIQRDIITNEHTSSPKSNHYSCQISMKLGFFDRFLKKSSNIKFYENLPSRSGTVPCGQTDVHDKTQSCVSQCCNHTYELNVLYGLQMKSKQWQPHSFNKTVHMLQFPQLTLHLDCSYFGKDLTEQN